MYMYNYTYIHICTHTTTVCDATCNMYTLKWVIARVRNIMCT
jgi:hypothetical protein